MDDRALQELDAQAKGELFGRLANSSRRARSAAAEPDLQGCDREEIAEARRIAGELREGTSVSSAVAFGGRIVDDFRHPLPE